MCFLLDLFNLRGSDIPYNPVFFAYGAVSDTKLFLFIEEERVTDEIRAHFAANNVEVSYQNYFDILDIVDQMSMEVPTDQKVWISLGSSAALTASILKRKRYHDITPINIMKAIKNDVEAEGMKNCHIRDGVSLVKYFAWLENEVVNKRTVTEISGATKLEEFRKTNENYVGLSFDTISGSGPNGSIIHYKPEPETDRNITETDMYLCDSGAQYLDGTTDVTRTWHFGTPSDHERECFTRVFKGQWQLGSQIFPNKSKGRVLDTLARKFLWDIGLDYGHGTGKIDINMKLCSKGKQFKLIFISQLATLVFYSFILFDYKTNFIISYNQATALDRS